MGCDWKGRDKFPQFLKSLFTHLLICYLFYPSDLFCCDFVIKYCCVFWIKLLLLHRVLWLVAIMCCWSLKAVFRSMIYGVYLQIPLILMDFERHFRASLLLVSVKSQICHKKRTCTTHLAYDLCLCQTIMSFLSCVLHIGIFGFNW